MDQMKRQSLLDFLDSEGTGDNEADHANAERMLLDYLDDPEITKAWNETPQVWWYA